MALLVEDGTIVAGAESYISVADCITYLDKFAANAELNTFTVSDEALQEAALRQATRFLDANYALRFTGHRYDSRSQNLQWPRAGATDNDGYWFDTNDIPQVLKDACCELALRFVDESTAHVTRRLMPDQKTPGSIKRKRLKADVTEIETEWVGGSDPQPYYALVDAMLSPILQSNRIALG